MEQFENDILNSLEDIQRAPAPEHLFAKIQESIAHSELIRKVKWQLVAASVAIIVACNAYAVAQILSNEKADYQQYALPYSTNFDIY